MDDKSGDDNNGEVRRSLRSDKSGRGRWSREEVDSRGQV